MKRRGWLYWVLLAIGAITVVSGLVQAAAPGFVLGLIGGEASAANRHSFAIVGMFMVLFGGLLSHALLSPADHPVAVLWAGLQKLGAAGAVGLGVSKGLFASFALLVAGFDLLSGMLALAYWLSIRASR
ncbi:MAG: patatin [Anaerolineales bacterium]